MIVQIIVNSKLKNVYGMIIYKYVIGIMQLKIVILKHFLIVMILKISAIMIMQWVNVLLYNQIQPVSLLDNIHVTIKKFKNKTYVNGLKVGIYVYLYLISIVKNYCHNFVNILKIVLKITKSVKLENNAKIMYQLQNVSKIHNNPVILIMNSNYVEELLLKLHAILFLTIYHAIKLFVLGLIINVNI